MKRKAEREAKKANQSTQNSLPNGLATIAYLIGEGPLPDQVIP